MIQKEPPHIYSKHLLSRLCMCVYTCVCVCVIKYVLNAILHKVYLYKWIHTYKLCHMCDP